MTCVACGRGGGRPVHGRARLGSRAWPGPSIDVPAHVAQCQWDWPIRGTRGRHLSSCSCDPHSLIANILPTRDADGARPGVGRGGGGADPGTRGRGDPIRGVSVLYVTQRTYANARPSMARSLCVSCVRFESVSGLRPPRSCAAVRAHTLDPHASTGRAPPRRTSGVCCLRSGLAERLWIDRILGCNTPCRVLLLGLAGPLGPSPGTPARPVSRLASACAVSLCRRHLAYRPDRSAARLTARRRDARRACSVRPPPSGPLEQPAREPREQRDRARQQQER
jgi:hypothetical protein